MLTLNTEWLAVLAIVAALLVGYLFVQLPIVRRSFIPGSLAAGVLLLVLGPQVAGQFFPEWQLSPAIYKLWQPLPGYLINIVFACLFLAQPIVPLRKVWRMAAPQAAFGQTLAWGQYALGGLVTMLVLIPLFNANPLSATLIEIGFEGGHGTASGLVHVFDKTNFTEGHEMAVGLATLSLTAALISGIILVHWGQRRGYIKKKAGYRTLSQMVYHQRVIYGLKRQGISLRKHLTPGRLLHHLVLVALAVFFGWLIHQTLLILENNLWGQSGIKVFYYVPMFTLCMFGGIIAQQVWRRLGFVTFRPIIELISAASLSILIVTAIATMSINYISSNIETFISLALVGVVWILLVFIFLAPRMFKNHWFQNGIIDMTQSMGQTATGLLFVKMVDPKDKTKAMERFGYKQLLVEPFMGGGVVTALSIPVLIIMGLPFFTLSAAIICLIWMVLGLIYFSKM